jgi:hypothetical protein
MIYNDVYIRGTNGEFQEDPWTPWPAAFVPRNTIGANFENALAAIDTPGTEFYVPYVSDAMSCDAVAANMQLLNTFINVWNGRLSDAERQLIRSRETIDNCKKIIYILTSKLGQYQVRQTACDNPVTVEPPVGTTPDGSTDSSGNAASGGSSMLVPVGLALAAILFIRSRNKKRNGTRKHTAKNHR